MVLGERGSFGAGGFESCLWDLSRGSVKFHCREVGVAILSGWAPLNSGMLLPSGGLAWDVQASV